MEEVLGSKGIIKIIKTLRYSIDEKKGKYYEENISDIAKTSKLSHNTATYHLNHLEKIGFVELKQFGKIKIYRLKVELPIVETLILLIEKFEEMKGKGELECLKK